MFGNIELNNGSNWSKENYIARFESTRKTMLDAKTGAYIVAAALAFGGVGVVANEISNRRLGVIVSNDEFSRGVSVWWMNSGCGIGVSRPLRIVRDNNRPPDEPWTPVAKCIFK